MPWDFFLIFAVLGIILPWRGLRRLEWLLRVPTVGASERIRLYLSTIAFQWTASAVVFWRARSRGLTLEQLGLAHPSDLWYLAGAAVGACLLGALHWANLRRIGSSEHVKAEKLRAIGVRIFPQSRAELVPYCVLALTAGVCEEFLYRGFSMAAMNRAGLPGWAVLVLSSILFGLAHIYQGRSGFLGTLALGTVFAAARIAYDSIVPMMFWHAAVDLVAGLAGPKYILRRKQNETTETGSRGRRPGNSN